MSFAAESRLTLIACVALVAMMSSFAQALPTEPTAEQTLSSPSPPSSSSSASLASSSSSASSTSPPQLSSRGAEEDEALSDPGDLTTTPSPANRDVALIEQDAPLAEANKGDSGHSGHSGHSKPMKIKKKKPMGKHKKKKQTFKDKLLPLLLIPFVIQTMLIPMFIMNLKFLAMKAMTVGKFAILLIAFNMYRSWSQNAHSTSIRGPMDSLVAQNYGYNGGPEMGAFFNGR